MDTNEGEDVMNTGPCFLPAEVAYSYLCRCIYISAVGGGFSLSWSRRREIVLEGFQRDRTRMAGTLEVVYVGTAYYGSSSLPSIMLP